MTDTHAQFEAWALSQGYEVTCGGTGDYFNRQTQAAWQGYQAHHAQSSATEKLREALEDIDAFLDAIRCGSYSVTDSVIDKAAGLLADLRNAMGASPLTATDAKWNLL